MNNIVWWLIAIKQEMTRVRSDDKLIPVTLLNIPSQKVLQHKTILNDWYNAIVVWTDLSSNWSPAYMCEYKVDESRFSSYIVWSSVDPMLLKEAWSVNLVWVSKWKWFQWWMKRYWFWWGPASHWSKFHRALWSTWNRKPRRTHKWKKMAWHMGSEKKLLKWITIVDLIQDGNDMLVVLKGSVPWAYNSYCRIDIIK